jgi:REP element-mobilizing transposase RayT
LIQHVFSVVESACSQAGSRRRGKKRGRKKSKSSGASHVRRERVTRHTPVHATTHLVEGLPDLRSLECNAVIFDALMKACKRAGSRADGVFRLTDYSIQPNHLHLIAEASDADALARGLNGLFVRIARGLNRLWRRKGKVFRERYHVHVLRTPAEMKNALRYVLHNAAKHGREVWRGMPDPFSSGQWFDGWLDPYEEDPGHPDDGPVVRAWSWMRRVGWRRYGLIPTVPG